MTIISGLKARLKEVKGNWVEELDSVLWVYRTSSRTETKASSFNLVYGYPTVIPTKIGIKTHRILNYDEEQNKGLLRKNLDLIEERKRQLASGLKITSHG